MRRASLVLRIEAGEMRTGLWCSECLTPARVEVDVLRLSDSGVSILGTCRRCTRCAEEG